jgi:mRNA-degrading endonuclease RelE of RelBE toxin-antitoxin system
VSAATQIYYASFDAVFVKLPPALCARIEQKIDEIGLRLPTYPHHRLKGSNRYRARISDYRIIYTFDLEQTKISPASDWASPANLSRHLATVVSIRNGHHG